MPSRDPRRGRAPAGADGRGDRAARRRRPSRRSTASRTCARAAEHAARDGVARPAALRAIAATIAGGLGARARARRDGRGSRRCSPRSRRRSTRRSRRSQRRSAAASTTTAPTCATTPRRACAACAPSSATGRHRVTEELRRLARSRGLQRPPAGGLRHRARRPARAGREGERAAKREGHRPRRVGSGQTLFVEPFAIVELNNRLAEAAGAEREEVERILRELSAAVGERAAELAALVEATAAIDLALACGTLSRRWRGAPVRVADEVRLLGARHPLLDPATAVPIDLDLGDLRVLVDQRPEHRRQDRRAEDARPRRAAAPVRAAAAGARRRAAGLRRGARRHRRPAVDRDEPLDLLRAPANIVAILDAATDALARAASTSSPPGTDPVEGSALAQALLARLAGQARLTLVTTHYPELKEWASATEGVANAATGFDPDTHAPLYRVALGRPGTSHALQIAERLGLDGADRRGRARRASRPSGCASPSCSPRRRRRSGRRPRSARRPRASGRRRSELAEQAARREAELEAEIERVRASAAAEREQRGRRGRARAGRGAGRAEGAARRDPRRAPARARSGAGGARGGAAARSASATAASARRPSARRAPSRRSATSRRAAAAHGAARCRAIRSRRRELGVRGTIALDRGRRGRGDRRAAGCASASRSRASGPTLRRLAESTPASRPCACVAGARSDVSDELDVRGMRAQEAREAVRAFVDDAALAGLTEVRVVHGRGTGAVRAAVRDELTRHPLVDRHESDSADGATVAHLQA